MLSRSEIQFWFRGKLISLSAVPPQKTVLRWLREEQGATGTKEGCAEGDCGACTVTLGSLDPAAPDGLRLRAVNSCLLFLPALDGKALFTVEDVAQGGSLHPVQRALVDLHASQCGFCTPGFVMSLWTDYQDRDRAPTRAETVSTLAGNLCRCTGYRPLLDAARAAWDHPVVKLDRRPAAEALRAASQSELGYVHEGQAWYAPRSASRLAAVVQEHPEARILAGGTDLALQVTKGLKDLGPLISVGSVEELHTIQELDGTLVIGAAVTLTDAFAALVARHPAMAELADRFASPPIRNAGTLGGNVANGSPIGDSMPALLALGAEVVLQGETRRTLPLRDFYLGYQKTALKKGEFVAALRIPPLADRLFATWKVSKRRDQDISAVSAGFVVALENGVVTEARLAYGGMAAVPSRSPAAELSLIGQTWSAAAISRAQASLAQDFRPLTDGRATADYRLAVAQNLLLRFFAEHGDAS